MSLIDRKMMTGEKFRELRERLGYTQAEFAEAFNVARTTITKWEKEGTPQIRGRLQAAHIQHVLNRIQWTPKRKKEKNGG